MEQKRIRRTCLIVLILALLLRLGGSTEAAPDARDAAFVLYLTTGRTWKEPVRQTVTEPQAEDPPAVSLSLNRVPEIRMSTEAQPDPEALLAQPVALDFSGQEPRILIVHTHTTESYTQEPGWEYEPSGSYRTLDEDYNMLRVGAFLSEQLNALGIPTVQAREVNDYPSYNGSYSASAQVIEEYLQRYPGICMVIDVHRDAVEYEDGSQMPTAREVAGQDCAGLLLVMGSDEGGLYHPDWQENLSWALKIQAAAMELYPDLMRPLSLRQERFNQNLTPGSILLEVGTAGDTMEEALNAAGYFARVLATTIEALGLNDF